MKGVGKGNERQAVFGMSNMLNVTVLILKATAILRRKQSMQWLKMQRFPIKQSYTL